MYQSYLTKLGKTIRILRQSYNYSQLELAKLINTSQASVNKWEHGISDPSSFNLLSLSKVFNVSTDEILNNEFKKNQQQFYINKTFNKVLFEKNNDSINISIKK